MAATRSVSGRSVPVYAWQTTSASALLLMFGPEELGGLGDLNEKLSKITATDMEERMKAISKVGC